eukprot:TRINITY_DN7875_c2_g2_i1.p1 TRINITY_DN7875_c2_g2~~TRINITY_DN7875_c2_g2_i1.p1  ORF type:complete len:184 (+),score=13.77 TRINITY_DN7875_c2_g2_i1:887-1438(+)
MVVHISDTGGLGDSEGRDQAFLSQIVRHVRVLGGVHGVLYVHNACVRRTGSGLQKALQDIIDSLSDSGGRSELWHRVGIVLTQCTQHRSIYDAQLNLQLRKRFPDLQFDLPLFWAGSRFDQMMLWPTLWLPSWAEEMERWVGTLSFEPFQPPLVTTSDLIEESERQKSRRKEDLEWELNSLSR